MQNSSCSVVTLAHHSTCSQGYPQKMAKKGGIFTALPLCGGGGRAVLARGVPRDSCASSFQYPHMET